MFTKTMLLLFQLLNKDSQIEKSKGKKLRNWGSNLEPLAYEADTLPIELLRSEISGAQN